jgi:peptidoglycan/LPS O-acetylase OafA/YrhL
MVAPLFPMLLIVPAFAIDFLLQRREGKRAGWQEAVLIAVAFLVLFLAAQWFFSEFMLSPAAYNWFFAGGRIWEYSSTPGPWRHKFLRLDIDPMTLRALGVALALSVVSSGFGLLRGAGLSKVQR